MEKALLEGEHKDEISQLQTDQKHIEELQSRQKQLNDNLARQQTEQVKLIALIPQQRPVN